LAGEAAVKHKVGRSFEVDVADGATTAGRLKDPFPKQVGAALDAPFHQQPGEELDAGRGRVVPHKARVSVADAAIGAELI
jgi:hypothetical protein